MATINTMQDLVRVLDENPEWLEELRSRLLTRELLELPDRFAQLHAEVNALSTRVNALSMETRAFAAEMKAFAAEMKAFVAEMNQFATEMRAFVAATDRRFELMEARMDTMDKRSDRMEGNIGMLKGAYAESRVARQANLIARDMGFIWARNLEDEDIRDLIQWDDSSDIVFGDVKSFSNADLIMEANDQDGETHYIPVETSFTADARDTNRALRNARLITRFTGCPAHPAVAGVRKDNDIVELLESGTVHWYQLLEEFFDVR